MHGRGLISIWFFIGILLTTYGVLITAAGIYDLAMGIRHNVVLEEFHAPVWWGAILLVIGLVYTINFRPGKR
jgi:hypothetical protein